MARIARVGAPAIPHHLTQRGNRRQETFFGVEDYQASRALMAAWCRSDEVDIWAVCLLPNHNWAALRGPAGPWGASGASRP